MLSKPVVRLVALEEDRDLPVSADGLRLGQLEQAAPAAGGVVLGARRVRVTGLGEVELAELRARAEERRSPAA